MYSENNEINEVNDFPIDLTPFKKNKILIVILVVLLFFHVVIASLVHRGAFGDGVVYLMDLLHRLSNSDYAIAYDVYHPRLFIHLINQFPINFSYFILGIKNKETLMMIYSFPLFLFPSVCLLFNCFLSTRTKRFDIAIWGLGLYLFFIAPSAVYSIVELRLAFCFYIILLNYLVGKIDYTKLDIGIILFLLVMLFNSHELVLIIGALYFLISFFYAKNEENRFNKNVKYFIGYVSLLASAYMVFWFSLSPIIPEAARFFEESLISFQFIYKSVSILTFISLLLILSCLFYRKYFSKPIRLGLVLAYMFFGIWVFSHLNVYVNTFFFLFRTWICYAFPIAIILVFIVDYFKIKLGNVFYTNALTVILLTGIFYSVWQLHHSYLFYKDYSYFQKKLASVNKLIVNPKAITDVYSHDKFRIYHNRDTYSLESILFSDEKKVNPVILPDKSNKDDMHKFYIKKDGKLVVTFLTIDVQNNFWDLRENANHLNNNKNLYEVK